MKSFKDILAWQKGRELNLLVYKLTGKFPKEEQFGLTSQLRRAAVSYVSNIAEGFGRRGLKEALHFYNISRGSLEEVRCQLVLGLDLGYLNEMEYETAEAMCESCSKILNGWMESQKSLLKS